MKNNEHYLIKKWFMISSMLGLHIPGALVCFINICCAVNIYQNYPKEQFIIAFGSSSVQTFFGFVWRGYAHTHEMPHITECLFNFVADLI